MATEVLLPKLGMNTEWATIVAWRKGEGDVVAVGEPLADVETDKAIIELEAETAGVLRRRLAADGERVAVNQTIAILGTADEDISALEARIAAGPTTMETHVERVYDTLLSTRIAPAPRSEAAPPAPPRFTIPAHRPTPGPEASRARRAARGRRGDDGAAAAPRAATNGDAATGHGDGNGAQGMLALHANGHANGHAGIAQFPTLIARPAPRRIVIYGAGLGAKQLLEITRQGDEFAVVGLIDDKPGLAGNELAGVPILGGFELLAELAASGALDGVALSFHSEVRRKVHRRLAAAFDLPFVSLIDPRAYVGDGVRIGAGVLVEAGAVVGPGTELGEGAIVDVGAIIAHDCSIGPFSHLSPGCALSGVVCLRENVLVGVGAALNSTVTVGRNVIITPGAAVMNDLPDDVIVGGVPAKVIGASRRGG